MREVGKSYLWCTKAWFRTKPGTTPRSTPLMPFTFRAWPIIYVHVRGVVTGFCTEPGFSTP